MKDSLREFFLP